MKGKPNLHLSYSETPIWISLKSWAFLRIRMLIHYHALFKRLCLTDRGVQILKPTWHIFPMCISNTLPSRVYFNNALVWIYTTVYVHLSLSCQRYVNYLIIERLAQAQAQSPSPSPKEALGKSLSLSGSRYIRKSQHPQHPQLPSWSWWSLIRNISPVSYKIEL